MKVTRFAARLMISVCAVALLLPARGRADTFCAGPITGINVSPYYATYPKIDGSIEGIAPYGQMSDVGWTGSSAVARTDGVDIPRITWRAGTALVSDAEQPRTSLFLGVTFDAFTEFSYDDVIVIAFETAPTSYSSRYHRLLIYPALANQLGDGTTSMHPRQVTYYTGALNAAGTRIVWTEQTTNPWYLSGQPANASAWIEAAVVRPPPTQQNPNPTRWELELRLPIKDSAAARMGIPMPTKFYFVAYDTHPDGNEAHEQWPAGTPEDGSILSIPSLPSAFGAFSQGACTGIAIYSSDLGTNHTKPGLPTGPIWATTYIDRFLPNRFKATVHNNTGGLVDQISASFFVANFGVPGEPDWRQVPAASNPTVPAAVSNPSSDLWTGEWTFSDADRTRYPEGAAHCLRAELMPPASGATVNFIAKTAWTNIKFLTSASPFQGTAEVSGLGYGPPRAGNLKQRFSLDVNMGSQLARSTGNAPKIVAGRAVAQSIIRVRAFRDMLGYVIINGHRYGYQEPVGSYMYVVERLLPEPLATKIPPKYLENIGRRRPPMLVQSPSAVDQPEIALPADVAREVDDAVRPTRWSYQLTGTPKAAAIPARYVVEVEPNKVANVLLQGQYSDASTEPPKPDPSGSNCRRTSGSALGLLLLGLLAAAPRARRKR